LTDLFPPRDLRNTVKDPNPAAEISVRQRTWPTRKRFAMNVWDPERHIRNLVATTAINFVTKSFALPRQSEAGARIPGALTFSGLRGIHDAGS